MITYEGWGILSTLNWKDSCHSKGGERQGPRMRPVEKRAQRSWPKFHQRLNLCQGNSEESYRESENYARIWKQDCVTYLSGNKWNSMLSWFWYFSSLNNFMIKLIVFRTIDVLPFLYIASSLMRMQSFISFGFTVKLLRFAILVIRSACNGLCGGIATN